MDELGRKILHRLTEVAEQSASVQHNIHNAIDTIKFEGTVRCERFDEALRSIVTEQEVLLHNTKRLIHEVKTYASPNPELFRNEIEAMAKSRKPF